ncbi:hypothetical protein JTB14_011931 [Gonioctena quinquepunctata]|nr:hypothetical protein JTB14_011931 [Gonioctena quinquepunctata]
MTEVVKASYFSSSGLLHQELNGVSWSGSLATWILAGSIIQGRFTAFLYQCLMFVLCGFCLESCNKKKTAVYPCYTRYYGFCGDLGILLDGANGSPEEMLFVLLNSG